MSKKVVVDLVTQEEAREKDVPAAFKSRHEQLPELGDRLFGWDDDEAWVSYLKKRIK